MQRHLVALLSALLLGCPVYQLNRLPASEPLAEPRALDHAGPYRHVHTNLEFPAAAAGFERTALTQFDRAGLSVAGTYEARTSACPVLATLYVYPAPRMQFIGASPDVVRSLEQSWVESEYTRSRSELLSRFPDAQPRNEGPITERPVLGLRGVFEHAPFVSELEVLLMNRQWFTKYRHTYPDSCASRARAQLESFHAALRQEAAT